MLKDYLDKAQELSRRNEPFALAVVVRREEPSSGKAGDKAVINRSGEILGWVGGGCVKAIIIKEAMDAIRSGESRLVRIGKHLKEEKKHGIMEYKMTCQSEGLVEVFIEPVLPAPHLVVVGKSAIARALVKLAKATGYRVTAMATDVKPSTFEGVDELVTRGEELAGKVGVCGTIDTLEHLIKGGRLKGAKAVFGSMLSIKPLLELKNGLVAEAGRARTRTKAFASLVAAAKAAGPIERIAVTHGDAPDVDVIVAMLKEIPTVHELIIGDMGSTVGTHGGPGIVGLAWIRS